MAKMRSLAPAFIIAVGGIFVLFMVISDSSVLQIFGQRSNDVGSVNGEKISYQQFSALLEQAKQRQKSQTGKDVDEENSDSFNDQVWDALVTQELIKKQIKNFHITVTDQEINDVIFGTNPPDFLKRQFTDSLGRFNRQLYESTLLQQKKEVLLAVEEQVRQMKLQEKLQSYLFASITVSEGEIRRKFIDQNTKMSGDYVLVDVNLIPDGDVKVTQEDLKKYYEKNIDKYKIEHQRKLKYVLFSKLPSREDSASIKNNLAAIVTKAKGDTASFKSYVDIYSEQPYKKDTVKQNQLPPDGGDLFTNANKGDLIGPLITNEGYVIFKLIDKVAAKQTTVKASHILIPLGGDDKKAQADAMDVYNKLIAGADFAQLAREKSSDFGSGKKGGDVGWFGKGQMVKEFEDACFNGNIGVIQKPVKTSYGYHIIKVTGKANTDYVVEKIVNKIKASGTTVENSYSSATDFAYLAGKSDFDSEVKLMNYKVQETAPFKDDATYIPGLGANKSLVEWAFKKDLNDISEVFKVPNGYIIAKISEITKAGVKKFEEVEKSLVPLSTREMKFNKAKTIAEKIYSQVKSGAIQLNNAISSYSSAHYDTTGNFTPSQSITNVGRDFTFNSKALEIPLGKISEPVKGQRGYYLLRITKRTSFDEAAFKMQRNTLRDNTMQEKKSYFFNQWLTQLKKESDIVDNRRLFFR